MPGERRRIGRRRPGLATPVLFRPGNGQTESEAAQMRLIGVVIAAILLLVSGAVQCFAAPAFGGEVCSFASTSTTKPPGNWVLS